MTEQHFCPLINGDCREDCTWFHTFTTITPDEIYQHDYCAMSVIANRLCDISGYGAEVVND